MKYLFQYRTFSRDCVYLISLFNLGNVVIMTGWTFISNVLTSKVHHQTLPHCTEELLQHNLLLGIQ